MAWFRKRRIRREDEPYHVATLEVGGTYRDCKGRSVSVISGPSKSGQFTGLAENGWDRNHYTRNGKRLDGKVWRELHWWSSVGPTSEQRNRLRREGLFQEPFKDSVPACRKVKTLFHDQEVER